VLVLKSTYLRLTFFYFSLPVKISRGMWFVIGQIRLLINPLQRSCCVKSLQAELEQVQSSFMKELNNVTEKLNTSEKAVAELRQMRRKITTCSVSFVCCLSVCLSVYLSVCLCLSLVAQCIGFNLFQSFYCFSVSFHQNCWFLWTSFTDVSSCHF